MGLSAIRLNLALSKIFDMQSDFVHNGLMHLDERSIVLIYIRYKISDSGHREDGYSEGHEL